MVQLKIKYLSLKYTSKYLSTVLRYIYLVVFNHYYISFYCFNERVAGELDILRSNSTFAAFGSI